MDSHRHDSARMPGTRLVFMGYRYSFCISFGVSSAIQENLASEAFWKKRLELCL
jgi:hypothetical protein